MSDEKGPLVVRKAAEVHKDKIDYTVNILGNLLNSCQERLDGYLQELEDMESLADTNELLADQHTKNRWLALGVKVSKDEHMKFYLQQEIERLEKTSLDIAIGLAEAEERKQEQESATRTVKIDGESYTIKKMDIDLSKIKYDGDCDEYCNKSVVLISEDCDEPSARVRIISGFNDDNNGHNAFDPMNYDKDSVSLILEHGDQEWDLNNVYEILETTNTSGVVEYDYLDEEIIHEDLKSKSIK